MKKVLLLILFVFSLNFAFSQTYPVTQILGAPQTLVLSKGGLKADSSLILPSFPDTGNITYISPYIKNYPGNMIRVGDQVYVRNANATKWLIFSQSASVPGTVTSIAQGYGITNTPSTIVGSGTIKVDTTTSTGLSGKYLRIIDTNKLVNKTQSISTTLPLLGGGNLSTNRTLSIKKASATDSGYLSSTDWNNFNNKVSTTRTISTTPPLSGGGSLSADRTIAIDKATSVDNGYLSSTDWNTFNNKISTIVVASPLTTSSGANQTINLDINPATSAQNGYLRFVDFNAFSNKVDTIYRSPGTDSIIFNINGRRRAIKDSIGSGGGGGSVSISQGYGIINSPSPITNTGTITVDTATLSSKYVRVSDTANRWVNRITRIPNIDSIYYYIGNKRYAIKDSSGGAGSVTSVGATGLLTSSGGSAPTISSSVNSNKLIGRNSTSSGIMQEITIGSGLSLNGTILSSTNGTSAPTFGSFYDSTTQTIASITTAYPIKLTKIDTARNFRLVNNKIIADSAGVYNMQWSGQFQNTDNAEQDATVWIRKNGVNVVGSAGYVSIPKARASINGHSVVSWNYIIPMAAGDSIVWYWQATDTKVSLQYYPQQTSPTRPSTASVIVTITPATGGGGSGGSGGSAVFLQNIIMNGTSSNRLGNYVNGDTIPVAGLGLDAAFTVISQKAVPPTYVAPTVTVSSFPSSGYYETGTPLTIVLSNTSNINDGGAFTTTTYYKNNSTAISGYIDPIASLTSTTLYKVVINYTQGACKVNNLGVLDCTGRINAGTATSSNISFIPLPKRYWGYTSASAPNSSQIIAANGGGDELTTSKDKINFNVAVSGTNQYVYYAYPASFGALTSIVVSGLESIGAFNQTTVSVTNAQGYSQNYYVYTSQNQFNNTTVTFTSVN